MENRYSRKQVADITGESPATLQQYTDKGLVNASGDSGSMAKKPRRFYTTGDMIQFLLCRELVKSGVSHRQLEIILRKIKNENIFDLFDISSKYSAEALSVRFKSTLDESEHNNSNLIAVEFIRIKRISESDTDCFIDLKIEHTMRLIIINIREICKKLKTRMLNSKLVSRRSCS